MERKRLKGINISPSLDAKKHRPEKEVNGAYAPPLAVENP